MNIHRNKFTDKDVSIHTDPIICAGCHEKFGITVHHYNADDEERYCNNCFFYKYGLRELQAVLIKLNKMQIELWTKTIDKIDPEVRKNISYIIKRDENEKD